MLDAVLPVVVLIALIALTIVVFGISATDGPLQVALLLSAAFAALMAFKNGYRASEVGEAAIAGVASAMSAIFILLAVGALIGAWNMAGTIPTVVDYGVRILNPSIFYLTTAIICAVVGMVTGSSWTTAGTLGVAFVGMATQAALDVLGQAFNISAVNLLPLALLVVFTIRKAPPFLAILGSALFAAILACFTQWDAVKAFVGHPEYGVFTTAVHAIYASMATGFVSKSGNAAVDQLFSRGGMASLLTTIWLVLAALSFAAIMEYAGFLRRLLAPVVERAPTRGRLIAAVNASAIGLNVIAGDQYVADVLPARMFATEFQRRGLAPQVLSRAVEDSGTVTSPLVPWNTCGAYMSGVLGVSTAAYFPYCFFNLLSPILDVIYGFIGFKVPSLTDEQSGETELETAIVS